MSREKRQQLDVLSFGESLVDFLPDRKGAALREVDTFRKVVGGAPTNLALGLARLGCRAGLHGKVGDDEFGAFILETLDEAGVDVSGVGRADEAPTGLTFVSLDDDGDRSFQFYRNESADMVLAPSDVDPALIGASHLFQVGSNLLIREGGPPGDPFGSLVTVEDLPHWDLNDRAAYRRASARAAGE